MIRSIIQIALIAAIYSSGNVLDMYGSYVKDTTLTIQEMIPVYTGNLYVTGGAWGRYFTKQCAPTILGEIESNSISINGEKTKYDTFTLKEIEYYKVTDKYTADTFYVMHINSVMKSKKFEIVVELREGPHYDRTIFLFEEGKRYMMLFWKDGKNIAEPDNSKKI